MDKDSGKQTAKQKACNLASISEEIQSGDRNLERMLLQLYEETPPSSGWQFGKQEYYKILFIFFLYLQWSLIINKTSYNK